MLLGSWERGRNLSRLTSARQRHIYAPYGTYLIKRVQSGMRYLRGPIVALLAFITGVAINNPNHDASLLYFQPTECAASNQTFLQT